MFQPRTASSNHVINCAAVGGCCPFNTFFSMELTATSTATRALLDWTPLGPTLIEDLDAGAYSVNAVPR